jgi:hypothetical protein
MIKPPFTIIILKHMHQPVTVRVTVRLFLMAAGIIALTGAVAGFGTAYLAIGGKKTIIEDVPVIGDPVYLPVNPSTDTGTLPVDIQRVSIRRDTGSEAFLTLHFSARPDSGEMFLWLIANPNAAAPGDMTIYPRNPIFQGMPVDYRNGIVLAPVEENASFNIALPEEMAGLRIDNLRILVYSSSGGIVADTFFHENTVGKS